MVKKRDFCFLIFSFLLLLFLFSFFCSYFLLIFFVFFLFFLFSSFFSFRLKSIFYFLRYFGLFRRRRLTRSRSDEVFERTTVFWGGSARSPEESLPERILCIGCAV